MDIFKVEISHKAKKDLKKLPKAILRKLALWVDSVERIGLREVRKISGYHDEPLLGDRKGQRSIRLNKSYRAIYEIKENKVTFIFLKEVNKHEY